MPVVRRGDGDSVDGFVLEELADIGEGLGIATRAPQHVFINITNGCNLHIGEPGKTSHVVLATSVKATDSYSHTIIGTKNSLRAGEEGYTPEHGQAHRGLGAIFQKVPTSDLWLARHEVLLFRLADRTHRY
jgi:hypothetical protein